MIWPDTAGILFPRRCPVCHEVVEDRGQPVCVICRTKLVGITKNFCQKCGKPLLTEEQEYCMDCLRKKHWFDKGRAAFVYDETMRRSIAMYKYNGRKEYAAFYAEEILRKCAKEILIWGGDILIPIPIHPSRRRKRGFNQAELLARRLSEKSGILMDSRLLLRTKRTHTQKDLSSQERLANLKDAFFIRKGKFPYKNIILVDDIYTTGSTVDAAARILKENGAHKVYFLCICVGKGY
ncbi:MAG TPA: amidophosphoribosyltransferase [Lachnospiraceae bacterium]|nr:amidophosphoribosyltransferase [Lachnospiraceae bacterium]